MLRPRPRRLARLSVIVKSCQLRTLQQFISNDTELPATLV
jgi:hypothetical protein